MLLSSTHRPQLGRVRNRPAEYVVVNARLGSSDRPSDADTTLAFLSYPRLPAAILHLLSARLPIRTLYIINLQENPWGIHQDHLRHETSGDWIPAPFG